MDLPQDLRVIHEPVRLALMGLLFRENDLGFTALRNELALTSGNLASHAAKLQEAGLIAGRDALTQAGFEKRFQMTAKGYDHFESYLQHLEEFLSSNRPRTPKAPAGTTLPGSPPASPLPPAPN
jgi:predicted transcriptional regulator